MFRFREENDRVIADGGRPRNRASAAPRHHQGVGSRPTRSSRPRAFQETNAQPTAALAAGKVDYLRGLKENVIMGRLIRRAGTGL